MDTPRPKAILLNRQDDRLREALRELARLIGRAAAADGGANGPEQKETSRDKK